MTIPNRVGVLGATSFVGTCLLPLLTESGWRVTAFSRRASGMFGKQVIWRQLPTSLSSHLAEFSEEQLTLPCWVCVAPIWVLPDYFSFFEAQGAKRVVVLSSTSRFTKSDSSAAEERAISLRFADAEASLQNWAENRGIEWVILRPTLIYGLAGDKNISEIARLICRFGFFPLFGKADGLRQPIHVSDVAGACLAALQTPTAANRMYNISGGEAITYRDMVIRVFSALDRSPRLLSVPLWAFRVAVALLRRLSRYRQWSSAMAEHMNQDFVFDHSDASRDLGFKPRAFVLTSDDLLR